MGENGGESGTTQLFVHRVSCIAFRAPRFEHRVSSGTSSSAFFCEFLTILHINTLSCGTTRGINTIAVEEEAHAVFVRALLLRARVFVLVEFDDRASRIIVHHIPDHSIPLNHPLFSLAQHLLLTVQYASKTLLSLVVFLILKDISSPV